MCEETLFIIIMYNLFRMSLSPAVLALLTYENSVLGSVHQHVEGHKGHHTGQTETAGVNLHTNLRSDRQRDKTAIVIRFLNPASVTDRMCAQFLPGNLCICLYISHLRSYQLYPGRIHLRVRCLRS